MVDIFPTARFGFLDIDADIEMQTLRGGEAISGGEDAIATDGGGRVYVQFARGGLVDRAANLAWRAVVTSLEEGVSQMVVPFCDTRHTPYGPVAGVVDDGVPHSDGTPFDDDSLYVLGTTVTPTTADAPLRATSIALDLSALAQPVIGGEWFSIEHPAKGWRAYRVKSIAGGTVSFRPPLREAVPAGTGVDFLNPRCLMVADMRPSTAITNRRQGEAAIRFVEAR